MNELALFCGAGGGLLGSLLLGWQTVCAVEIDPFCADRIMQRQNEGYLPAFPIWDDVYSFDGHPWRDIVDIVSGGFPCQNISSAGDGTGIDGEKSGLWKEMVRIISEVRPRYVFVENSPALIRRGIDRVLGDLAELGFNAKWGIISAAAAGACHIRERIWILADADSEGFTDARRRSGPEKKRRSVAMSSDRIKFGFPEKDLHKAVHTRKDDVMAHGLDRRKAVGEGQVPAVVKLAWETLSG